MMATFCITQPDTEAPDNAKITQGITSLKTDRRLIEYHRGGCFIAVLKRYQVSGKDVRLC